MCKVCVCVCMELRNIQYVAIVLVCMLCTCMTIEREDGKSTMRKIEKKETEDNVHGGIVSQRRTCTTAHAVCHGKTITTDNNTNERIQLKFKLALSQHNIRRRVNTEACTYLLAAASQHMHHEGISEKTKSELTPDAAH